MIRIGHRGAPGCRGTVENTVDSLKDTISPKAVKLFGKYGILSKSELHSRYEIYLEQYTKQINIEAQAALHMTKRQYIPAVIAYTAELADTINSLNSADAPSSVQEEILQKVSDLLESTADKVAALEKAVAKKR